MPRNNLMEKIIALTKHRGFIFPGSEIYGGLSNSWDYGPLGVELKNNIKQAWWKFFVQSRSDVVGIDGAILMNPKVWEASGHLETFHDPLVECKVCHTRVRADQADQARCTLCGAQDSFTRPANFSLMLKTFLGPKEDQTATVYLRPETAQTMFVDFPLVLQTLRPRVPFGIAQIGKAFRNEITPGNFIYRLREFEIMELEYFVPPHAWAEHFERWLRAMKAWLDVVGIDSSRVHELEVPPQERAHYSQRTVDLEFEYPFGRKELYGLAYRGDFDLQQHAKHSGKNLAYTDPASSETYVPHVIEPTFGLDRTILAVLLSAYHEEEVSREKRVVLKLKPYLAPYPVAVLPLSKKEELMKVAEPLAQELRRSLNVDYDSTQSIGKRYRRQDEIGTPYCVTVDFDTLEDQAVTVRDRDTMEQERIALAKVRDYLQGKLGN